MDAWKNKYLVVNLENGEIQSQLKKKNELIKILEKHITREKPEDILLSHIPHASRIINQLILESAQLKNNKKQKKGLEFEARSSSKS